jgi:hypothetical protein
VYDLCQLLFNLKSDKEVENIFLIPNQELENVIKKIIASFPDIIFEQNAEKLEEIKNIFAKEFIFFQVQERLDDPQYQDDLVKFTYIFSRDIQRNFTREEYYQTKTEEE